MLPIRFKTVISYSFAASKDYKYVLGTFNTLSEKGSRLISTYST